MKLMIKFLLLLPYKTFTSLPKNRKKFKTEVCFFFSFRFGPFVVSCALQAQGVIITASENCSRYLA